MSASINQMTVTMRFIKIWLFLATTTLIGAISFVAGRHYEDKYFSSEKDYQAACILSDCCRNMVDNIGLEAEEIYHEYIDNLDCYPDIVVTKEDMEEYYWSY